MNHYVLPTVELGKDADHWDQMEFLHFPACPDCFTKEHYQARSQFLIEYIKQYFTHRQDLLTGKARMPQFRWASSEDSPNCHISSMKTLHRTYCRCRKADETTEDFAQLQCTVGHFMNIIWSEHVSAVNAEQVRSGDMILGTLANESFSVHRTFVIPKKDRARIKKYKEWWPHEL